MANKYVRKTDGLNTDTGATWALAKANLKDMAAASAAGDVIYISQAHAETNAAATTITMPLTVVNPCVVIGANDSSEPPAAVSTTPTIATTGASNLSVSGGGSFYGLNFNCGNGYNYSVMRLGYSVTDNAFQRFETCNFTLADTHPSSQFIIGSSGGILSEVTLRNCGLKVSSGLAPISLIGKVHIIGGGFLTASAVSALGCFGIGSNGVAGNISIEDFDFSTLAATAILFKTPEASNSGAVRLRNCKLPAAWSGRLVDAAFPSPNMRIEMWNSDSGNTNYKLWVESGAGKIRDEEIVVMTGGSSDGTTPSSMIMTTNSNASLNGQQLISPELLTWNDTTGATKTATVEIIHDSATALTDAEVWLELEYLGTSASTLGVAASDRISTILTTPAAQTASTATWTTTGLTTPNTQKLEVTFTPQKKGLVQARVVLAKASKTIYVDSKLTVA